MKRDRKYHIEDTPALEMLNDLDAKTAHEIPPKVDPDLLPGLLEAHAAAGSSKDNPQLLAIMEKMRMYILRAVRTWRRWRDAERVKEHIVQLRVKPLRDTEDLLVAHVGIAEAKQFIEDNSHPPPPPAAGRGVAENA
uniref:Uncharacterized protein n=1 Tax=Anopheles atroparvus TaxID=41427 RepID=A0A182IUU4_ANOAO